MERRYGNSGLLAACLLAQLLLDQGSIGSIAVDKSVTPSLRPQIVESSERAVPRAKEACVDH